MKIMNNIEEEYGDVIYVKVNGKPYKTYIDKNGVQRFIPNKIIEQYVEKNGQVFNNHKNFSNDELYTHNSIGDDLYSGKVSLEDYLEFQTMHNSSVDYFDSTATQTLAKFFENSEDYNVFEKECQEKDIDLDSDEEAYYECMERHESKFIDKYYHIDNPLWE